MNNFTSQSLQPPVRLTGMTVSSDVPSRRTRWKNRRQEITQFKILHTPEKTPAALLLNPLLCGRRWYDIWSSRSSHSLSPGPHAQTHNIKIQMTTAMSPQWWRLIDMFWLEPLRFHANLRTWGHKLKRCDYYLCALPRVKISMHVFSLQENKISIQSNCNYGSHVQGFKECNWHMSRILSF